MSKPAPGQRRLTVRRARTLIETLLLGLLVGVLSDRYGWEPALSIRDGWETAASLIQLVDNAWFDGPLVAVGDHAPRGPVGATRYAAGAKSPILAATGGPEVTLFDDSGTVLHRWRVPVETLFTVPALMRAEDATIDGYRLLADGSLLAIVSYETRFPSFRWGDVTMNTVLAKIDAQSALIWTYQGNPHHDLATLETGETYVLVARDGATPTRKGTLLPRRFRDEGIAILDPAGHETKTIWLGEALANSPYAWLEAEFGSKRCYRDEQYCWDLFHANSIEVLSRETAAQLPVAEPGDLLVNLRALDSVVVVDPVTERVRWALHGSWHRAHDVHATASGTLMMFDNLGNIGGLEPSRIVEIDPRSGATLWQYDGGRRHPFFSSIRGNAEPLANGDVLVTESMGGRIFEVSRAGEIAWEYVSPPARNSDAAPIIWGGRRIDPADYPFLSDGGTGQIVANPANNTGSGRLSRE